MIRFSLVINNQKNEYLICERQLSDTKMGGFEFVGGEIAIETLPSFEWLKNQMEDIVYQKISVEIDNIQKYELYWRDESPLWIHAIFTATIKSGNPQKGVYTKLLWLPVDKINVQALNEYGVQVFRKINECNYCHFINDKKSQLDDFFESFFAKEEENLALLEAVETVNEDSPVYILAFKQELIHLRAFLIESTNLKKNITVQNYFRLYNRDDLAKRIDALLLIEVKEDLSLREMIKESVDKYIAHYDKPSAESHDIYKYCVSIFSVSGRLPLKELIRLLDGYIMALITEMWYDAGELGISMSERSIEQRNIIINFGNDFAAKLIHALKVTTPE